MKREAAGPGGGGWWPPVVVVRGGVRVFPEIFPSRIAGRFGKFPVTIPVWLPVG